MKIHAIQTGTVTIRPNQREGVGSGDQRLLNTMNDTRWTDPLPINVWVIEHPEGIIVIDTGETSRTSDPGYFPDWHPYYKNIKEDVKSEEEEVGPQLRRLGINPDEVKRVLMTHLHTDHAGGLHHFPKSEIMVMRDEFQNASGMEGQKRGFLPQHWPSWFAPRLIDLEPQRFGPFQYSLKITKAEDVVIVPTYGHTDAHVSVVLILPDLCYFFAGDSSYTQKLMLEQKVDGVSSNEQQAILTLKLINQFVEEKPTVYMPTHDPLSVERLNKTEICTSNLRPLQLLDTST
jgi:N-acyl homoserine lactone hydrolase